MRSTASIALVVVLLLSSGCGPAPQNAPAPAAHERSPIVLGPKDAGHTLKIARGDRLMVVTGPRSKNFYWTLASYPRALLALRASDVPRGRYELAAVGQGKGTIVLRRVFACASCPINGDSATRDRAHPPARSLAVRIAVVVG
jgi:hypothetical protein